jgi:hypothetical protein
MGREVLADGHKPTQLPALLISVLAHGHHSVSRAKAAAPSLTGCASARGRVSKTQIVSVRKHLRAARRQRATFIFGVVADKVLADGHRFLKRSKCPRANASTRLHHFIAGNSTNTQREAS